MVGVQVECKISFLNENGWSGCADVGVVLAIK